MKATEEPWNLAALTSVSRVMRHRFSIVVGLSIAVFPAYAQYEAPTKLIDAVPGDEEAVCVIPVSNNRAVILGQVTSSVDTRARLYVLRSTGDLQATMPLTITGSTLDLPESVIALGQNQVLVTFSAFVLGQFRTVAQRMDLNGNVFWQTTLPGTQNFGDAFHVSSFAKTATDGTTFVAYPAQGATRIARLGPTGAFEGETVWPGDDGTGARPFALELANGGAWVGVVNGTLSQRFGLLRFDGSGQILWARSQTQDVINVLGDGWLGVTVDGKASVVASEEGPNGSNRTTATRYAPNGTVLDRRMWPPASEMGGGRLLSASILASGVQEYALLLNGSPYLIKETAGGQIEWQMNLTGQLGESGSSNPTSLSLHPSTHQVAMCLDSGGFAVFGRNGTLLSTHENNAFIGPTIASVWQSTATVLEVTNVVTFPGVTIAVRVQPIKSAHSIGPN